MRVNICGLELLGLIDTGASISCLAGKAAQNFLLKNVPYKKFHQQVETAGGEKYEILGSFVTDVSVKDCIKPICFYIIPSLKQDLYLGADFCKNFDLLPPIIESIFLKHIDSPNSTNIHPLTSHEKKLLQKTISLFPSFEQEGLGRTSVIKHKIEVFKDTKPIKQRYFSVSPAVEKKIRSEVDRMLDLGVIEPAPVTCSWSSPVTLLDKNGKMSES